MLKGDTCSQKGWEPLA